MFAILIHNVDDKEFRFAPRNLDVFAVENRNGRFIIRTGTIIETPRAPVLSVNYPKGPSCIGATGEDEA